MTNTKDPDQTALIRLLLKEQSDQGPHSFVNPSSPNIYFFYGRQHFKHYAQSSKKRNTLTWFLKFKKILAVILEFYSNWLRLITLCENITLFWPCGPDCTRIFDVYRIQSLKIGPHIN